MRKNPKMIRIVPQVNEAQLLLDNKYVLCFRKMLGKGTYATVYEGYDIQNPQKKLAIKMISCFNLSNKDQIIKNSQHAQQIANAIQHPNVVDFIDIVQQQNNIYFILELCEQGNLKRYLDQQPNRQLQCYLALKDMNNCITPKQFINLKPQNIVFKQGIAKIADFGFANIVHNIDLSRISQGTHLYCAPELLEGSQFDSKADIWSMGCILYEMLYGRPPFKGIAIQSYLFKANHGILQFPQQVIVDDNVLILLKGMFQPVTSKRFSWDEIFVNVTEGQFIQAELQRRDIEERICFIDDSLRFQKEINEFLNKAIRKTHQVMNYLKVSKNNQILLMVSSAMMVLLISSNFKRLISETPLSFEIGITIEDIKLLMTDRTKYYENLNWINSQFYNMLNYINDVRQKIQQIGQKFQPETLFCISQFQVQLIKDLSSTQELDANFIETYNNIIKQSIIELYQKISSQQNSSFLLTEAMKSIIKLFYCLYPFKFRINEIEVILLENEINLNKEKGLKQETQSLILEHQLIIA